MKEILHFIADNWTEGIGLAAILYELIMRFIPTEKNRSLIDLIFKVIGYILPNFRKKSGHETVVDYTKTGTPKNIVKVPVNKHIVKTLLILVMLSIGLTGYSQTNVTGKLISSVNADSTIARTVAQNLFNTYGGQSGSLYYNYEANKWRITEDSAGVLVWRDLIQSAGGGGSGTVNGATNGLHLSTDGTKVRLGGTLVNDTLIDGSAVLTFSNTSTQFGSGILGVRNPGNTFRYNFTGSAIVANRAVTLPLLTGDDTFTFNDATQTLNNKTFGPTGYFLRNPANTFSYNILGGAITSNFTATYAVSSSSNTIPLIQNTDLGAARVLFFATNAGRMSTTTTFTYNAVNDILNAGRFNATSTTTNAGLGLGTTLTSDPSGAVDGDLWFRSDLPGIRARISGTNRTLSTLTNGAGSNVFALSNGTNLVGSSLTSITGALAGISFSDTDNANQTVISNFSGTITSAGTSTQAISDGSTWANNTTLQIEFTIVGIKTDGSESFSVVKSGLFRKDNTGTWTMDQEDATSTIKETVVGSVVGITLLINSSNPSATLTMGATSGTFNIKGSSRIVSVF